MNRRAFLKRSGGLAALTGLAGCLGSVGSDSGPAGRDGTRTDETTAGDSTTGPGNRFSGVRSDRDEPFQTISVGNRDDVAFPDNNRARRVRVWNAADEAREIGLRIDRDGELAVDRSVEFAADAYLAVSLNEPANYRVTVGLARGDAEETSFEVPRSSFDCNSAGTDAGVMPDGRVETMSASTAAGCPSAEITDSALSVGEGTCGEQHSASVGFADEAVRVDGAVRTSTPNSDLTLGGVGYDRETDALTVRVRATEGGETEAGVQCVGEVPYEATVEFDYDLPASVVVVHESMDETTEVARTDRQSD